MSKARLILEQGEQAVRPAVERIERVAKVNQQRVLEAFWQERVSTADLAGSTGYGLDDGGRDKLERVWARVFATEGAIVRPQLISGTHALRVALFGLVRPGDHVLFATGHPYDTLEKVVGIRPAPGSLQDWGVSHSVVPLDAAGHIDLAAIRQALRPQTRLVMFQKSRGYQDRPALTSREIGEACRAVHELQPGVWCVVDNCYGEFVEEAEPTAFGADLAIGSLIKNPGGGIATTGGYIAGRAEALERIGAVLTAPGVGLEAGPTHHFLREFYQGLFLAPHAVGQALKGSVLAAWVLERLGFDVAPRWTEPRADLILAVSVGDRDRLLTFCSAIQRAAPVDAHVVPQGAPMPGYESPVVMAAGTFVQGGSLELSADAPLRRPFTVYLQGGLTYEHVFLALERVVDVLE
ncbi:MAG: methionine gamma-lyase family protein [Alicyclobacillaceae bacterium]|nr:methionine gamma-lyase family protein [Alicyclobacillaceae bacterium]